MLDWLEPIHYFILCCCALPVAIVSSYLLMRWTDRAVFVLFNAPAWTLVDEEE